MPESVRYIIEERDLNDLISEIQSLRNEVKNLKPEPKPEKNLLKATDIMKDLRISMKTLHRRLYESENPIPMVKEGNRLVITKDKFEAWKRENGL